METLKIRTHIDSETLHLPQIRPMLGKDVLMVITETSEDKESHPDIEPFFALAGNIKLDIEAIRDIREKSMI